MVDWAKLAGDLSGEGGTVEDKGVSSDAPAPPAASSEPATDATPPRANTAPMGTPAPTASLPPEATASVPLEVSKPSNFELSGPVQATMPAPSSSAQQLTPPGVSPLGVAPQRVPEAAAQPARQGDPPAPARPQTLKGFAGPTGDDDVTKTAPFMGQSAGPWEVPHTPPPEPGPDASVMSEITDPRRRLARGIEPAPIASAEGPAPAERWAPAPVTGLTPALSDNEPPSIGDDDDDEPSATRLLPEAEMLRRLDVPGASEAPVASEEEPSTQRGLPSIVASDESDTQGSDWTLPSVGPPPGLAEQAAAGVGPFAPPSTLPPQPAASGLSEGPSLEQALTQSLAEEEARASSSIAADDDEEASTVIDHELPAAAALDGYGAAQAGATAEGAALSAPPSKAEDAAIEATEKVTRVRESAASAVQTRQVDAFFSAGEGGDEGSDVTLKMSAAPGASDEGAVGPFAEQDDDHTLKVGVAPGPGGPYSVPAHEATDRLPRTQGPSPLSMEADRFFEAEPVADRREAPEEPEERSHYAPAVQPWSEDDEDPSLVIARAQRRTRTLTLGVLMLLVLGGVGAFLYLDAQEAEVAPTAEAEQPNKRDPAPAPKETTQPPAEQAAPKVVEPATEPPAEDERAREQAGERERAAAAAKAERDRKDAEARAEREREAKLAAERAHQEREAEVVRKRDERRSRARSRSTSTPSRRGDRRDRVAGATERQVAVTAPKRVVWRTPTGKRLGKGSGFLKLPAGVSTVVAHDPFSDVKSFIKVTDTQIAYANLPKGKLDIRAFPYAAVYAGKKKLGDAPFPPLEVVEGQYQLRFVYEGKVQKRMVKVKADKTVRVKVNFMQ